MNLKCDPQDAFALRDNFPVITPGYHMNKQHWNTLTLNGSQPDELTIDLINHTFELAKKNALRK
ncbi:MAG: MmcQ/YjbR family DNA-binding protein [Anaerolineales bacterium]|nr:MmcQ/YjbR family DNA-binding protein [Anaerolineales bacterium]